MFRRYTLKAPGVTKEQTVPKFSPAASPTDPTLGWNVFNDQKYGVSFRYPKEYDVEPKFTDPDSFVIRVYSKPVEGTEGYGRIVLVNILITKSSSDDKSTERGRYSYASNIYNRFTNYKGDIDILQGTIMDVGEGFVTKTGELELDNQKFIMYDYQSKIGNVRYRNYVLRKENKTLNIEVIDHSLSLSKPELSQADKTWLVINSLEINNL